MAIIHFKAQLIGIARSAVAAAAYRHRTTMTEVNGKSWSYRPDKDLVCSQIVLPDDCAPWLSAALDGLKPAKASNVLWNLASAVEDRFDAQIAREFVIALPIELTRHQNIALMQDYVREFTRRGFVVDWVLHDKPGNPHVHLMHTLRPVTGNGFGRKTKPIPLADGSVARTQAGKIAYERFAGTKADFLDLRDAWYDAANRALASAGYDIRLSGKSYADQGINILPQRHLGPALAALKRQGVQSEALAEFASCDVMRDETVRNNPHIAVDIVASQRATFAARDVAKALHMLTISEETVAYALPIALADPRLIGREGITIDPRSGVELKETVYTTQAQIDAETSVMATVHALAATRVKAATAGALAAGARIAEATLPSGQLTEQQSAGLRYLTADDRIAVLSGLAGTGKSTLFLAAHAAWRLDGIRVQGAALSAVAARGLEASSGIPSRTVASLIYAWSQGKDDLKAGDVLVVDEAGMIATDTMRALIEHAAAAGAKVVLSGDPEQLQPIGAGAPLRAIIETIGVHELNEIVRQRDPAERAATTHFARGRAAEGLAVYKASGSIVLAETTDQVVDQLVRDYVEQTASAMSSIALAYTNAAASRINLNIRQALIDKGLLSGGASFTTADGAVPFAAGDRAILGATKLVTLTDGEPHKLARGALGTVVHSEIDRISLRLDDGAVVILDATIYNAVSHGYAMTIHKAQGISVDRVFALASQQMDRHMAYVAFSRHRHALTIYGSQGAFGDMPMEIAFARSGHIANATQSVTRYLERRGIRVAAAATGRILDAARDGRSRLANAWAMLEARTLSILLHGRALHMPSASAVSAALTDSGLLSKHTGAMVPLMRLLIAHNVQPAAIAAYLAPTQTPTLAPTSHPGGDTMALNELARSIVAAAQRLYRADPMPAYLNRPDLIPAPAPPPPRGLMSIATVTATAISVTFEKNDAANAIIKAEGYAWSPETQAYTKAIPPSDRVAELARLLTARSKIDVVLAAAHERMAQVDAAVKDLQQSIGALHISKRGVSIYVAAPKDKPALAALAATGGRAVIEKAPGPDGKPGGAVTHYSFKAPSAGELPKMRTVLSGVAAKVPRLPDAPRSKLQGAPGIGMEEAGLALIIRTAPLPRTLDLLAPAQPAQNPDGTFTVRMDVIPGIVVKAALDALQAYHQTLLIPPHNERSGIDLPERDISELMDAKPDALLFPEKAAPVHRAIAMITNHFGGLDKVAHAPGTDPIAAARVATVAAHLQSITQTVARAQSPYPLHHDQTPQHARD